MAEDVVPLDGVLCPHNCGLVDRVRKHEDKFAKVDAKLDSHERYLIRLEHDIMEVVIDTQAKSTAAAEQLKYNVTVLEEVKQALKEFAASRRGRLLRWWPWWGP